MKPIYFCAFILSLLQTQLATAQQTFFEKKAALPAVLSESSGLACTEGKVWTINDSGHPAILYSIDSTTGAIKQVVTITNYPNTDWEDITADNNYIYIGDFGNNNGTRKDLKILKIAKADIGSGDSINVSAQAISFSYPDQTRFTTDSKTNFDCESLLSVGDSLYIFTKNLGDFQSRLYSLPKTPGTHSANFISQYNVDGKITGAAINPSNNQVVLLGYTSNNFYAFIIVLKGFSGTDFFSGTKNNISITNTIGWQTEAISYHSDKRIFLTCESAGFVSASLYATDETILNDHILSVKKPSKKNAEPLVYPNPTQGSIYINTNWPQFSCRLYTMQGVMLYETAFEDRESKLDVMDYPNGFYMIEITTPDGVYFEKILLE